jgi:hypothetical protein
LKWSRFENSLCLGRGFDVRVGVPLGHSAAIDYIEAHRAEVEAEYAPKVCPGFLGLRIA